LLEFQTFFLKVRDDASDALKQVGRRQAVAGQ
jgi:hypothetical protein